MTRFLSRILLRAPVFLFIVIQLAGCTSQQDRARNYYNRGMKLFADHDNARAAIEFRNAVRLKPDLIDAWRPLAQIDETSRNWPRFVTDMRAIVALAPNDASVRLKLGKLLLFAGLPEEALSVANTGLDLDSRNAQLHALKAAIMLKRNDRAAAVREAKAALNLDPANADAQMVLAIDQLDSGNAKGALSLLQATSAMDSAKLEKNLGFQLLKIKLFGETGDLKSVETTLKKLVELNPRELGYRKLLISFYIRQNRIDKAEAGWRALVADNPSDPTVAIDLVRFLYSVKKDRLAARKELDTRISAGGKVFPFQVALAEMNFKEGHSLAARNLLEHLISSATTSEHAQTARLTLAQMDIAKGDLDPADKLLADVLHENPDNVPALKLRAAIHLQRFQPAAAVADLAQALNYQPGAVDLMSLLATAYERDGLIELADKQFADAMRASSFDAKVGLKYAEFLRRRGSIGRAEDILIKLTKVHPSNIRVLSTLAEVRLARQDWIGAQSISKSIRRLGDSEMADQILGASLIGRERFDDAVATLQNAYNATPRAALMDSLVRAFLKANKKSQATAFLKSVLAKAPGNANALVLLGSIQLASGETDLARKSFRAAMDAQPTNVVGNRALADFYLKQKNYDGAIQLIQTAIKRQPNVMALRMILAHAFEEKRDYEAAIAQYDLMLAKQPGNLIVANNLASLLLDHHTDPSSLKRAQSIAAVLRKSPVPQFKDTLCWASYHEGDYRTAVMLCEQAAAALPEQAAVRYHLGLSLIAAGQPADASKQLKKALQLTPNGTLAGEIRSALEKVGS